MRSLKKIWDNKQTDTQTHRQKCLFSCFASKNIRISKQKSPRMSFLGPSFPTFSLLQYGIKWSKMIQMPQNDSTKF